MSTELLLIFIVTLIVFGPKKLPMLATHLGLLLRKINQYKSQATLLWQEHVHELQLRENQNKAAEADKEYAALNKNT
jgi:Sec-independent protein translocase protein TatA